MRTHLQRLAKNTGKVDPRLAIEWPALGLPIWNEFKRLGRPPSMNGIEPIGALQIDAHQRVYRIRFTDWELDTIAMFDAIAMEVMSKQR
ncbi:MAG: hypothetical protein H7Z39_16255 [Burkholderiaceae bacterium]|nr:hypothetical protein [Burkholderiaceae bacterium]